MSYQQVVSITVPDFSDEESDDSEEDEVQSLSPSDDDTDSIDDEMEIPRQRMRIAIEAVGTDSDDSSDDEMALEQEQAAREKRLEEERQEEQRKLEFLRRQAQQTKLERQRRAKDEKQRQEREQARQEALLSSPDEFGVQDLGLGDFDGGKVAAFLESASLWKPQHENESDYSDDSDNGDDDDVAKHKAKEVDLIFTEGIAPEPELGLCTVYSEMNLQESSNAPRDHGSVNAFRVSWTHADEFVRLVPSAANNQSDPATTFDIKQESLRTETMETQGFGDDAFERLLFRSPHANFGRDDVSYGEYNARLEVLKQLANATVSTEPSFSSCFSLVHAVMTAWNEGGEEFDRVEANEHTPIACMDKKSHEMRRIEAQLKEWFRDEFAQRNVHLSEPSGTAQLVQMLVQGQWDDAQNLAFDNGADALGTVLSSALWSVQSGEIPAVMASHDWFAQWTTVLAEDLCACAGDLFEQMSQSLIDEGGVQTVFEILLGRLQGLFQQVRQRDANANTGGKSIQELIAADWTHALAVSLFYGRKDNPDAPEPLRNGAAQDNRQDLFLTRIIREYTAEVVGEKSKAVPFAQSFRDYTENEAGVLPKAPLHIASESTSASSQKAYASFVGSPFQSRVWHILNVLRCVLELYSLHGQPGPKNDGAINETVQLMFFHAFSSLAISIGVRRSGTLHDHRLVWYLAVVLDKVFKTLEAKIGLRHLPRAFSSLMRSWGDLIIEIASTHAQERAAHPARPVGTILRSWLRLRDPDFLP